MYKENKEFCEEIANKIGYYFKIKKVKYTNVITKDEEATIKLEAINEGVAPLYEKCFVYIGLLDENNNLIKKYETNIKPNNWQPEENVTEEVNLKYGNIDIGTYKLAIGMYLNKDDENPTYLLGNEGKTKNNWYIIGTIEFEK